MFLILSSVLGGCASTNPYMLPDDGDQGSQADGAAYAGDGMLFRKPMPDHRDWKPFEFYYKHCALSGEQDQYEFTQNVYECTGP